MSDNCFDPVFQWRAFAEESTSKVVPCTGRKDRQCCGGIDRRGRTSRSSLNSKKPSAVFAERAVATNNDDRLDTRSSTPRAFGSSHRRSFRFVGLILNAGGVELFLNGGPNTPRFGGVVDYDEDRLYLCNLWMACAYPRARARLAACASSRARGIASTARAICGSASLKTCVAIR